MPSVSETDACRLCGGTALRRFDAAEMMFGTRERFDYLECNGCGCVQIAAYPADIARHYPPGYYAHGAAGAARDGAVRRLGALFRRLPPLWRWWIGDGALRRLLPGRTAESKHLAMLGPDARILDIGCGSGEGLRRLRALGFRHAEGADPFIAADILHEGRLLVRRAALSELEGAYDAITLHHALEHMPDQHGVFRALRRLLAPGGVLLLRLPVVGGVAWRRYGADWVQLDAPRHFYLHSRRSLGVVAAAAGFAVRSMVDDSTSFQFWGSELYRRGIPLNDPRSPAVTRGATFSKAEMADFARRARAANAAGEGDQVAALLVPARSATLSVSTAPGAAASAPARAAPA